VLSDPTASPQPDALKQSITKAVTTVESVVSKLFGGGKKK
jgi:hypothetical protein